MNALPGPGARPTPSAAGENLLEQRRDDLGAPARPHLLGGEPPTACRERLPRRGVGE